MARPRAICFTINNPSEDERRLFEDRFVSSTGYGIWQLERGASGTLHIQGYGWRDKPTTFTKWKEIVGGRAHIEGARGTAEENKAYCSKQDTRVDGPFEHGVIPQPGRRSDLSAIIAAARDPTIPLSSVIDTDAEAFVRYHRGLERIRALSLGRRTWKTEVFWFWGSTGTGKSREANELAPNAYWKQGCTKWWCGYEGQEDVIIDDYRRDLCAFHELLRLFDRYPMQVETKGGNMPFLAKRIFVTTPKGPQLTWESRTEEDVAQLMRRIENIKEFN